MRHNIEPHRGLHRACVVYNLTEGVFHCNSYKHLCMYRHIAIIIIADRSDSFRITTFRSRKNEMQAGECEFFLESTFLPFMCGSFSDKKFLLRNDFPLYLSGSKHLSKPGEFFPEFWFFDFSCGISRNAGKKYFSGSLVPG